jgi:hypothetical protein
MERISAAYCLFCEIGRSFFSILERSQFMREKGSRFAYEGENEVMFSRMAIVSYFRFGMYLVCGKLLCDRHLSIHRVVPSFLS